MSHPGKLYLLPMPISEGDLGWSLPPNNVELIRTLKHFIAEDAKTARRHLKACGYPDIGSAEILLLNEHSREADLAELSALLAGGMTAGLMSEAGCPAIADPGADLVRLAHRDGVEVVPLAGPSAIVLSIMASGFNGQNFAFNGYLPMDRPKRVKKLKELEQAAGRQRQAQFFIETPYRNEQLYALLLETLEPQTLLFIGKGILSESPFLRTRRVSDWRSRPAPQMRRVPAVFGIFK